MKTWKDSLLYQRPTKRKIEKKDNTDKYVSPRILGRLGKQMFEIATAFSFAFDNKSDFVVSLDKGVYGDVDGKPHPPTDYKDNIFRYVRFVDSIENYETWNEKSYDYQKIRHDFSKNLFLNGFFQSEKYFKHNRELILDFYKPTEQIKNTIKTKYGDILEDSVSIHIRRKDRIHFTNVMPLCSLDYYKNALLFFNDVKNVIILTDDIGWTKKVFIDKKFHIIENEPDYIDLYIMSMCSHNIIANSAFSWWGAWLNKNPDKLVIAPKEWLNKEYEYNIDDLIPESWIKL
jgi:hypothetical protein